MTLVKFNADQSKKSDFLTGNDHVFNSIFSDTFFSDRMLSRVPAANISESADHFRVELSAPGLNKEHFKLKLDRNVLTISAEQQNQQEDKNYLKREFACGSFMRAFALPESANTEGIEAKYIDGILCIDIPKREEAKMVSRQIEIK
jgi:HSP20 family protein